MSNVLRARVATLLEHFHLTLDQIGDLTDRQIHELYYHPRQEDGTIEPVQVVPQAGTLEHELFMLDVLGSRLKMRKDKVKELKERLRTKWQARTRTD